MSKNFVPRHMRGLKYASADEKKRHRAANNEKRVKLAKVARINRQFVDARLKHTMREPFATHYAVWCAKIDASLKQSRNNVSK